MWPVPEIFFFLDPVFLSPVFPSVVGRQQSFRGSHARFVQQAPKKRKRKIRAVAKLGVAKKEKKRNIEIGVAWRTDAAVRLHLPRERERVIKAGGRKAPFCVT